MLHNLNTIHKLGIQSIGAIEMTIEACIALKTNVRLLWTTNTAKLTLQSYNRMHFRNNLSNVSKQVQHNTGQVHIKVSKQMDTCSAA